MECSVDNFSFGKNFKDFEYVFEPKTGQLRMAWSNVKIITAAVSTFFTIGGGIGGVTGAVSAFSSRNPWLFFDGVTSGAKLGSGGGAAIGFFFGGRRAIRFTKSVNVLSKASREGAEKIKIICNALMKKTLEESSLADSIFCPISGEILAYPVKTLCSHTFDYSGIRRWIEEKERRGQTPDCPACRRPAHLQDLIYQKDIDRTVALVVGKFFERLSNVIGENTVRGESEHLFQRKKIFHCRPAHEAKAVAMEGFVEEVKRNGYSLNQQDVDRIVQEIAEDRLNKKDAYIISMTLAKSVERFQNKIDWFFSKTKERLDGLISRREISAENYRDEMKHLRTWHNALSLKR